jgi:hypothetical protein
VLRVSNRTIDRLIHGWKWLIIGKPGSSLIATFLLQPADAAAAHMDGDESMLEPGVAGGFAVVYDQLSLPYGSL